LLFFFIFNPFD